jgi:hypothetical protein
VCVCVNVCVVEFWGSAANECPYMILAPGVYVFAYMGICVCVYIYMIMAPGVCCVCVCVCICVHVLYVCMYVCMHFCTTFDYCDKFTTNACTIFFYTHPQSRL